jgi:phosphatidylinositol dimannoside acyltransferase
VVRDRGSHQSEPGRERGASLSLEEEVAYWAYRGAAELAHVLPERVGQRIFESIGLVGHAILPNLRSTVADNQAGVIGSPKDHPSVRSATRDAFRLYARYWFDSFKAVDLPDREIVARFEAVGFDNMRAAAAGGKGVIAVLPHLGNWDVAGRWMAIQGFPVVTVAEELRPKRLFELFMEHRRRLLMDVVGLGDPSIVKRLSTALADGRVVALVADRDIGGRGVPVEMFGRTRMLPAGPASLAIRTGAPVMVCPVTTTPDGWRCVFEAPIEVSSGANRRAEVRAITQEIARGFERAIAGAPADWHMFQPAWNDAKSAPTSGAPA